MGKILLTNAEVEAIQFYNSNKQVSSTEQKDPYQGINYILSLAERIKNERQQMILNELAAINSN